MPTLAGTNLAPGQGRQDAWGQMRFQDGQMQQQYTPGVMGGMDSHNGSPRYTPPPIAQWQNVPGAQSWMKSMPPQAAAQPAAQPGANTSAYQREMQGAGAPTGMPTVAGAPQMGTTPTLGGGGILGQLFAYLMGGH